MRFRTLSVSIVCLVLVGMCDISAAGQRVRQTSEVVKAYRVCETFQRLLADNLDFSPAYEGTFTRDTARRRAVAIRDGELGNVEVEKVADGLLIEAYKHRMQLFYLMLPLAGPDSDEDAGLFFPPDIKQVFNRKPPDDPEQFGAYVSQLEQDVVHFRTHMDRLAREHAFVAERIRKFKMDISSGPFKPPKDHIVKPQRSADESRGLRQNEKYYEIEGYTVVREGTAMKIVSIRFFTRLF